jgi:hypothetical protein
MESKQDMENGLVLDALQASLGLVSPGMKAIAVLLDVDRIVLHFAVSERSPDIDEDIDDIAFELDALREGSIAIVTEVHVGVPDASWSGRAGRLVYLAKGADTA